MLDGEVGVEILREGGLEFLEGLDGADPFRLGGAGGGLGAAPGPALELGNRFLAAELEFGLDEGLADVLVYLLSFAFEFNFAFLEVVGGGARMEAQCSCSICARA